MIRFKSLIFLVSLSCLPYACAADPRLETAQGVDLARYMGRWYSLASIPQWFEKGCSCTMAEYELLPDGRVRVVNQCRREGRVDRAEGVAKKKGDDPARLKVSFFRPFWGEYSIIHVDDSYSLALVGSSDRNSLWILSRSPVMEEKKLEELKELAASRGFDPTRLRPVVQDCVYE